MATYIGLLRAVNVAGHNPVRMADLKEMLLAEGLENVRTLLQSGNVVFETAAGKAAQLEAALEKAARRELGLDTEFLIRTSSEWARLVKANPFPREALGDPGKLLVMVLKGAPPATRVTALREAIRGREVMEAKGRTAYIVYPDGLGRSKLTTKLIEQKLGVSGTGRNWNTVQKLQTMVRER